MPPLDVRVTEKGVKVIDGHHRYYGAIEATKAGADIIRLECKDFVGNEADRIAFMVTRNRESLSLLWNAQLHISV